MRISIIDCASVSLTVLWLCVLVTGPISVQGNAMQTSPPSPTSRSQTWVYVLDTHKMTRQDDGALLFLLPIATDLQKIVAKVSGATSTQKVILSHNELLRIVPAQRFVEVELTCTPLDIAHDATVRERLTHARPAWNEPSPEEARKYLKRTAGMDHTTADVKALAQSLKGADRLQTATAIMRYVNTKIKYDFQYFPSVDEILSHGVTQCEGRSATAVALMRCLDIPARLQFMQQGKGVQDDGSPGGAGGHTVVDFYIPGAGWITMDPGTGPKPLEGALFSFGEEPIPYYYLRTGMGALLKKGQTLERDYPAMMAYLKQPENHDEFLVATAQWDSVWAQQYLATTFGPREQDPPKSERVRAIEKPIEGTDWTWAGEAMTFGPHGTLRAGAQSSGTWRVCEDMSVEMSWGKGMTYRITFDFQAGTYQCRGVDNTGQGSGKQMQL